MAAPHSLATWIVVAAVASAQDAAAPPPKLESSAPRVLKVGAVVTGEVGPSAPVVHTKTLDASYTDVPVRGASFTLDLEGATTATIELRSYLFDAYLVVRDATGEVVAEDDDGLLRTHSRVVLTRESAARAASYEVVACALHGGAGAFELRVDGRPPAPLDPSARQEAELADARLAVKFAEERLGPDHPVTAANLRSLGNVLDDRGAYDEARPVLERALAIREKALGPEEVDTAMSLDDLATLLRHQGRLAEAKPLLERSLAIVQKRLGPDHPTTSTSLGNLGVLLQEQGDYSQAQRLFERALAIAEKSYGPDDVATGMCLENVAFVLVRQAKYEEARPLYVRALAISEKRLGPEDLETAVCLDNLAALLDDEGKYEEARPLYERALAIRSKTLGPEHPDTATNLENLALLLKYEGRYDEARPMLERALAIHESRLGPAHASVATDLNNLAGFHDDLGEYEEARRLYERAHDVYGQALGPDHPQTLNALTNLANVLRVEGRFEEARRLYERALAAKEKVLGPDHPATATSLCNLAVLLEDEGRWEEARPLYERALAIDEKSLGPNHPTTATSLGNLARLLRTQGKFEEARPLYERAIAIQEKALGPNHPTTLVNLDNFAEMLETEGRVDEAQPILERALATRESVLGPVHTDVAASLANVASVLRRRGRLAESGPLLERALAIDRKVLGPDHPHVAKDLANWAVQLNGDGRCEEARAAYEEALALQRRVSGLHHPDVAPILQNLTLNDLDLRAPQRAVEHAHDLVECVRVHAVEEARRATASDLVRTFASIHEATRLLLAAAPPAERGSDRVYADVLAAKGAAFRVTSRRWRELVGQSDPETRRTLDRLQTLRATMSSLLTVRTAKDAASRDVEVERVRKERAQCEAKLATLVAERPDLQAASPEQLRAALPKDAVLLDFRETEPYEPVERADGKVVRAGRWSARHFEVWISRGGAAATTWLDLGPSAAIASAIDDFVHDVLGVDGGSRGVGAVVTSGDADARSRAAGRAKRLRELVWDPIAARLDGGVQRVVLGLDGALATLPFGVLVDESGHALLERYAFACVEDVDSLVRPPPARAADHAPTLLVAGGVDYDDAAKLDEPAPTLAASAHRGGFTFVWPPLGESRREADGVAAAHRRRFGDAPQLELVGAQPREERLKAELGSHEVLHLATHGYFLARGLRSIREALRDDDERAGFVTQERTVVAGEWPQFLCGLVCAGANHPQSGCDDGLLTGDEVASLDLSKCDLVVLSACETALGRRQAGEGMLSLTRSFREAGARTVVSTLWQVRDDSTKELMLDFYARLWGDGTRPPQGKLDALRGAQLAMLQKNREKFGETRPATWGAFVLTGDER